MKNLTILCGVLQWKDRSDSPVTVRGRAVKKKDKKGKEACMREYFKKLYGGSEKSFHAVLRDVLKNEKKMFVLTANPEMFMIGAENPDFDRVLKSERTVIVPDGIGIVRAARSLSLPAEKITGVEIVSCLLRAADEMGKSLYLYGAKPEVLEALTAVIHEQYPHAVIAGMHDGYSGDAEPVFADAIAKKPDIMLVALGIPRQELLIDQYYDRFDKGIFIGVGGSFDVLSGCKKRAPAFFIKLNLEWLYRIVCEPKRMSRFFKSNVRFLSRTRKLEREGL